MPNSDVVDQLETAAFALELIAIAIEQEARGLAEIADQWEAEAS